MIVVCSLSVSSLLRKTLETMLDGSEQGRLSFSATELHLQSVDAMNVCLCTTTIRNTHCPMYRVRRPIAVNVQLRSLYHMIKGIPNAIVAFTVVHGVFWVQLRTPQGPAQPSRRIVPTNDTTQYYQIPRSLYEHGTSFRLHPEEFVNTILDVAVGGGYLEVSIRDHHMYWKTQFETGTIAIVTTAAPLPSTLVLLPHMPPVTNTYLTKFFKQACTIAPSCTGLVIFMQTDGPIVLHFETEDDVADLVIAIVPILAPSPVSPLRHHQQQPVATMSTASPHVVVEV